MKTTIDVPVKRWAVFTGQVMRKEGPRMINFVINNLIEDYIREARKEFASDS